MWAVWTQSRVREKQTVATIILSPRGILTLSEMLTLDEMTELEPEMETKQHMEEYLETFDTSLQSDTPYSDVTQVRKYISRKIDGRKKIDKKILILFWVMDSS